MDIAIGVIAILLGLIALISEQQNRTLKRHNALLMDECGRLALKCEWLQSELCSEPVSET